MKNLQEATERICDLKGSILALDTLVTALAYALPTEVRAELLSRLETHAEVARTVLLQAEISETTLAAFERDVGRAGNIVRASLRQAAPVPPLSSPSSPKENTMPKGQRSSKEAKKPKKDQSSTKPLSPVAALPTKVTVVPDRSKKK